MRIACYCLIGFLASYGTWTIVSAWLNCVPVAKFWDDSIEGFCLSKKGLWFSNSAIHILTDIMIIIYPMPALSKLRLPTRQKAAVMGIFSLGGLYVFYPFSFWFIITNRAKQRVNHHDSPPPQPSNHLGLRRPNLYVLLSTTRNH